MARQCARLINALEYAVVTCEGAAIELRDLPYQTGDLRSQTAPNGNSADVGQLARIEQNEILRALERFGGNGTRAAEFLSINTPVLRGYASGE